MQTQPVELQLPRDTRARAVQRKDPMARVKIKCRTENQVIPGGYILPKGESICLVYMPDLPTIQAMIEPEPEAIDQARVFFEKSVINSIKDELKDITDDDAKKARIAKARQEYSGSVEGTFYFLQKRDILPLESVEVLEKDVPAPVQQQQIEQNAFLATTIAQALAATLPQIIQSVLSVNGIAAPQQSQASAKK